MKNLLTLIVLVLIANTTFAAGPSLSELKAFAEARAVTAAQAVERAVVASREVTLVEGLIRNAEAAKIAAAGMLSRAKLEADGASARLPALQETLRLARETEAAAKVKVAQAAPAASEQSPLQSAVQAFNEACEAHAVAHLSMRSAEAALQDATKVAATAGAALPSLQLAATNAAAARADAEARLAAAQQGALHAAQDADHARGAAAAAAAHVAGEERICGLEGEVAALKAVVATKADKADVATLRKEVDELKADVADLMARALKLPLTQEEAEMLAKQLGVVDLRSKVGDLDWAKDHLGRRLAELESKVVVPREDAYVLVPVTERRCGYCGYYWVTTYVPTRLTILFRRNI